MLSSLLLLAAAFGLLIGLIATLASLLWQSRLGAIASIATLVAAILVLSNVTPPHESTTVARTTLYSRVTPTRSCVRTGCPPVGPALIDHGGSALPNGTVFDVVRFSSSPDALTPLAGFVPGALATQPQGTLGALSAILSPPYSKLWSSLTPTAARAGHVYTIVSNTLTTGHSLTDSQINDTLFRSVRDGRLPANHVFILELRLNQEIANSEACGYHTSVQSGSITVPYIVLPNNAETPSCSYVAASDFANLTFVLSHEVAETLTDPFGTGWYAGSSTTASETQENGDLCINDRPFEIASPKVSSVLFWVTPLYSPTLRACVTSGPSEG